MNPTPRHWLLLMFLVLAWGFAFYLIAIALRGFNPLTVVWIRLTLGALVMVAFLGWRGGSIPRSRHWLGRLLLLSVTGNLLPFTLIAWAEQRVASGEVGMLMALMPMTVMVLAHFFLRDERLTLTRITGVGIGFIGVLLLLGDNLTLSGDLDRLSGQLAAILATVCYAANGIYTRRLPEFDTVAISAGSLGIGALLLTGPVLITQDWTVAAAHPTAWLAAALLGVAATGFATWVYFTIVSEVGPGFLSTINYLIPGVAFAAGVVFLNEQAQLDHLVALALILAGVAMIQPRKRAHVTPSD